MLKPPISRLGGKSKLRKTIIEMIPEHICYVEPFFGAGWVFFGKEPSKVEVINDIDSELINLFKIMKYHEAEISRLLQYEICARDLFKEYKKLNVGALTDTQRAVRFIYVLSQSFASKGNHFGYGTTSRPNPQIFETEQLKEIKNRLRNTYIENLSFEKIFEKYDRPHTFFFCDPPYFETEGYGVEFGEKEHLLLMNCLRKTKGMFLLTINDHEKVREWYRGFNFKEVDVIYSVSREQKARKPFKELIITNYKYKK